MKQTLFYSKCLLDNLCGCVCAVRKRDKMCVCVKMHVCTHTHARVITEIDRNMNKC